MSSLSQVLENCQGFGKFSSLLAFGLGEVEIMFGDRLRGPGPKGFGEPLVHEDKPFGSWEAIDMISNSLYNGDT